MRRFAPYHEVMRTLIDGYNLMYAGGLLGRKFGPDGFRKVRHRFLNDLAAALDPIDAHQTTIVFDASNPPPDAARQSRHKGLTIIYAVGDEDADSRLEFLIAHDSAPKGLTVVSSDHRIRQAAHRRKATVITSDEYWDRLKAPKRRTAPARLPTAEERGRREGPSSSEAAYWLEAFGALDEAPETREALRSADFVPTDEEIAQIEREVERESFGTEPNSRLG